MALGFRALGSGVLGGGGIDTPSPATFQPAWFYINNLIGENMYKKNTAVTGFVLGLVSATDGSDITTGTPVGYYTLDGGTQTAIGDVTPVHEGNGQWSFDLLAAEMNGDVIGLTFTHASAITQHFTIKTDTKIVSELVDITAAQVNTECDTALTDYDAPTNAEMIARTLVAASYFDPTADTVANVTLVATTTTNTDMRGTDSAALASVCTETRLAELDSANLPTDVAAIPTTAMRGTDSAATSAKQDTMETTLNAIPTTAMRGTDNAATATNLATVDTNVDSILVGTTTTIPALIAALNDLAASDILTTQLSESYAADGAAPTLTQALMLIQQALTEFSYATTLNTVKRLDGSTTAAVMTLDDATLPTSSTRTS